MRQSARRAGRPWHFECSGLDMGVESPGHISPGLRFLPKRHRASLMLERERRFERQQETTFMSAGVKIGHSTPRERCVAAE
jgi:hypothetical protein